MSQTEPTYLVYGETPQLMDLINGVMDGTLDGRIKLDDLLVQLPDDEEIPTNENMPHAAAFTAQEFLQRNKEHPKRLIFQVIAYDTASYRHVTLQMGDYWALNVRSRELGVLETPSYDPDPYEIAVTSNKVIQRLRHALGKGKVWILSLPGQALSAENVATAGVHEVTDDNEGELWLGFMENSIDNPVYDLFEVRADGTILVQLEPEWTSYRDDTLDHLAKRQKQRALL